jgi:hypothetical protein
MYSYEPTKVEQAGIVAAVAAANAQGGTWTNDTWFAAMAAASLAQQALNFQSQILTSAISAYPKASKDNQAIVLSKLGLSQLGAISIPDQMPILASMGLAAFLKLSPEDQQTVFTALGL